MAISLVSLICLKIIMLKTISKYILIKEKTMLLRNSELKAINSKFWFSEFNII